MVSDLRSAQAWGLNAIEDQRVAGLILWIPARVVFTMPGMAIFAAWVGEATAVRKE